MNPLGTKKELLSTLWKLYLKQKNAESEAGREVKSEVEAMRGRFRAALEGRPIEMPPEHESDNPLVCEKCGDAGWYYSERANFEVHGRLVQAPGMRVCMCPQGIRKNRAIQEHGRTKKQGRTRKGEV